jgi:hypothetical protein
MIGGNGLEPEITLGILSWKSYTTLQNTLESYKKNGILSLVKPFIYFQELGDKEKEIANKFQIPYIGTAENIHIRRAFIEMVKNVKTPYFIFAEVDFELIHPQEYTVKILSDAVELIKTHSVQQVKLRDKKNYGEPLGISKSFKAEWEKSPRIMEYPYKLEAFHFIENPKNLFPGVYTDIQLKTLWHTCSNRNNWWSNNIFMSPINWLKDVVVPYIESHPENNVLEDLFYENKGPTYTVAFGDGLFKHNRLDR